MPPDTPCPSTQILRRSLDPDDPMPEPERQRIETHLDHCDKGCKQVLEALLRGHTLAADPEATRPVNASSAPAPERPAGSLPGYEILDEIGRGGMGVVYKARHLGLNRLVALKMILAEAHAAVEELARFRAEAEAVAALQHANVVQIHDIGAQDGRPYFSLEFVEGGNLAQKLAGAPQPPGQAAQLVETLARAVHFAHQRGIVHRDLKPANVLLTADGRPKITDFGLVKRLDDAAGPTRSGAVMGTPSYMAPEQAAGKSKEIGPATDVYALGTILYECLTGRPPFKAATTLETLQQVLADEPAPPRQLQSKTPRDLETICLKCLEKEPLRRYGSAEALADDLRRFQAQEPITARPVGPWTRAAKWARRRPTVAVALAIAMLSLLAGTVASTSFAVVANDRADQLERSRKDRAQAQVDALLTASPGALPGIMQNLRLDQEEVLPRLRQLWDDPQLPDRQRQRVALALLPVDPGQVDYLYEHLLDAEPDEVGVFVQQLSEHKGELTERLWAVLGQPGKGRENRRLRAAAALAAYDPDGRRWDEAAGLVVERLVEVNPVYLSAWMEALRPVRDRLLEPLAAVFRDHTEERATERSLATDILADYAADNPRELADLLMDADDKQFAVIYPKFKEQGEKGFPLLTGEIDTKLPTDLPSSDEQREKLAKRQANAAAALLRMSRPEKVWPLLKRNPDPDDPRVRSYLIHRLGPCGADAGVVIHRLDDEPDVTIRRALLLSLGEFGEQALSSDARKALLPKLQEMYRTASDPGLHGAAEWLLRTWRQEAWLKQVNEEWAKDKVPREKRLASIEQLVKKDTEKAPPQWYVNGQGQTMVVIPGPVEFKMGSPSTEAGRENDEIPHKERIGRTFALAAKPVTVEQYWRFEQDYHLPSVYTRTADLPVIGIDWYMAARYCNWLSEQEGVPEEQRCYEIKGVDIKGVDIKLKAKYLSLGGYRLPTEAEMEVATRAGAVTSRYFGETDDLLSKYAWYLTNSQQKTWPVGSLKPNDFGLFDLQGNVFSWCQEEQHSYPTAKEGEASEDNDDLSDINNIISRTLRGGSFASPGSVVRSAYRYGNVPTNRTIDYGFRLARTFR